MGLININNAQFETDFYSGSSSANYKANVHELIHVQIPFSYSTNYQQLQGQEIINVISISGSQTVLQFTGTTLWQDLGFSQGDSIVVNYTSNGSQSVGGTVSSISGDTMTINAVLPNISQGDTFPSTTNGISLINIENASDTVYGIKFKVNHNKGVINLDSQIDGEQNIFENLNVPPPNFSDEPLTQLINKSGGYITDVLLDGSEDGGNNLYTLKFTIALPYGALDIFQAEYSGGNTFKLDYEITIYNSQTNGSSNLSTSITEQGSSVASLGYYNQVFNGGTNPFNLFQNASMPYWQDVNNNALQSLDYGQVSTFTCAIQDQDELLTIQDRIVLNLFHVPQDADWKNRPEDYFENVMMNRFPISNSTLTTDVSNSFTFTKVLNGTTLNCQSTITNLTMSGGGTQVVLLTFDVTFNADAQTYFDSLNASDKNFRLTAHVQRDDLNIETAKRVNLILSEGLMQKELPVGGEFDRVATAEYRDLKGLSFATSYVGTTEDTLQFLQSFRSNLDTSTTDENVIGVQMAVVAINSSTGEKFDLERHIIDFPTNNIGTDGTYLLDASTVQTRNYTTFQNSSFQDLKVERNALLDAGDLRGYNIVYSFRALWQYWEALSGVNSDFATNDAPTNYGKNKDWQHYQSGDWILKTEIIYVCDTIQYFKHYDLLLRDYNSDPDVTTTIYLEDENSNPANALLAGQRMKLKCDFLFSDPWFFNDVWVEITTEPKEDSPRPMVVNFADGLTSTPFEGVNNSNNRVELTLVNPNLITAEIYVNVDQLNTNQGIASFTARIYESINNPLERVKVDYELRTLPTSGYFPEEDRGLNTCKEKPIFQVRATQADDKTNYRNNKTAHCLKAYNGDVVELKLYKDGTEVAVNDFIRKRIDLPKDPYSYAFQVYWQQVFLTYGIGCYEVQLHYTIGGVSEIYYDGFYDLKEWSFNNVSDTVNLRGILGYKNLGQTTFEWGNIDFTNSNLEHSIRFNGSFGDEKIDDTVENYINTDRQLLGSKRDFRDRFFLVCELQNSFITSKLKGIVRSCDTFRITDHRPLAHRYDYYDVEVVLDTLSDGGFTYTNGRKASFGAEFLNRLQTDVSNWNGGTVKDFPSTVNIVVDNGGSGGTCDPANYVLKNSQDFTVGSGNIPSGSTQNINLPDITYNVYVNGIFDQNVDIPVYSNEDININA